MFTNVAKISQEMKNKSLLVIEKKSHKVYIIIRKDIFLKKNDDLESSFDEDYKDVLKL